MGEIINIYKTSEEQKRKTFGCEVIYWGWSHLYFRSGHCESIVTRFVIRWLIDQQIINQQLFGWSFVLHMMLNWMSLGCWGPALKKQTSFLRLLQKIISILIKYEELGGDFQVSWSYFTKTHKVIPAFVLDHVWTHFLQILLPQLQKTSLLSNELTWLLNVSLPTVISAGDIKPLTWDCSVQ